VLGGLVSKVPVSFRVEVLWLNADERGKCVHKALGAMGVSEIMKALTTIVGRYSIKLSNIKFVFQFGYFMTVTVSGPD